MSSNFICEKNWMNEYIDRVAEQRDIAGDILENMEALRYHFNEANLETYNDILKEMQEVQNSLSVIKDVLRKFQYLLGYSAQRLEQELEEVSLPSLFE